jgi:hypothetical protein
MDRKVRLSTLLPIVQVSITAVLTAWANRVDWMYFGDTNRLPARRFLRLNRLVTLTRLLWRGVNAPTYPLCLTSEAPSPGTLGLGVGGILYLVAVGVLWYRVGKFIDDRRGFINAPLSPRRTRVMDAIVLIWGVFLLGISILDTYRSLHLLPSSSSFFGVWFLLRYRPWVLPVDALFLMWSLALVVIQRAVLARLFGMTDSGKSACR